MAVLRGRENWRAVQSQILQYLMLAISIHLGFAIQFPLMKRWVALFRTGPEGRVQIWQSRWRFLAQPSACRLIRHSPLYDLQHSTAETPRACAFESANGLWN